VECRCNLQSVPVRHHQLASVMRIQKLAYQDDNDHVRGKLLARTFSVETGGKNFMNASCKRHSLALLPCPAGGGLPVWENQGGWVGVG
jgi:hypothetical protein